MVGIPGKSKGCITCRRRKIRVKGIGCAAIGAAGLTSQVSAINKNPTVTDASKAGGTAKLRSGYATYPTFLNHTINGPAKRHGLEEAKPRQIISGPSSSAALSSSSSTNREGLQLSRSPSHNDIFDFQLLAHFWQSWVPIQNTTYGYEGCSWLQQAIAIQNPKVALSLSIKALAFTRLGWLKRDTALATRGSILYGQALRELQKSLWDERMMWLDETLAAAYALSVYELFETTTSSISGWNSHLSGLGNLVRLRGPRRHRSSLGRAVLEAYRLSSMVQSVQFRTASFLLEPDWRALPWDSDEKDLHQKLYHHGFKFGALQSRIDEAGLQRGELTADNVSLFLGNLNEHQAEIDAWYQDFLSASPSPLYWVSNTNPNPLLEQLSETAIEFDNATFPNPFTFPNLRLASVTITYWALKIIMAGTFRQLMNETATSSMGPLSAPTPSQQQTSRPVQQLKPPSHEKSQTAFTFAKPQTHFGFPINLQSGNSLSARPMLSRPSPSAIDPSNNPIKLAINIIRAMPFCLSDDQGIFAAPLSLFGLRTALFILRLYPGMELKWCQSIYRTLDERKGLRYAKEIAKVDGGHGTRGIERKDGVTPAVTPPPRPSIGPYTVTKVSCSI